MLVNMFSSTWFAFSSIVFLSSLALYAIHTGIEVFKIKETMQKLSESFSEGDHKINENFEKIHNDLSIVERELNQVVNVSKNLCYQSSQPSKHSSKYIKPIGKKHRKFLTPKGKIKKHYKDDPEAQEYYQKFHKL